MTNTGENVQAEPFSTASLEQRGSGGGAGIRRHIRQVFERSRTLKRINKKGVIFLACAYLVPELYILID